MDTRQTSLCGARTADNGTCRNPVGPGGRCRAGHRPSAAAGGASVFPAPTGFPTTLGAAEPGSPAAGVFGVASPSGPAGFGGNIAPQVALADAAAEQFYQGDLAVGHVRLYDHTHRRDAYAPFGEPLGTTYVGPVSAVDEATAHDRYGVGDTSPGDLSRKGGRAGRAARRHVAERLRRDDVTVERTDRTPEGHRAVVWAGDVRMVARVTESGRWPRRRRDVEIEPRMLVGTSTEVSSARYARALEDIGPVERSAMVVQGLHGRDIDGGELPRPVAGKFDRLDRRTSDSGAVSVITAHPPRPMAKVKEWAADR